MNFSKYISDFYDTKPTFETLVNKEMVVVQNPTGGYFNHVELQASAANDGNVQVKLCGLANENWSCGLGGNWSETVPNWKAKISTGINLKHMPSDISESLENVHKHVQVILKDGLTIWNEHHAKTNKTKRLEAVRSDLEASMVISPHMTDGASSALEPYLAKNKAYAKAYANIIPADFKLDPAKSVKNVQPQLRPKLIDARKAPLQLFPDPEISVANVQPIEPGDLVEVNFVVIVFTEKWGQDPGAKAMIRWLPRSVVLIAKHADLANPPMLVQAREADTITLVGGSSPLKGKKREREADEFDHL
jgi:hypothetical protein